MFASSRFTAILNDIQSVRKDDPFAKFVVFSQYIESLVALEQFLSHEGTAAMAMQTSPFRCVLLTSSSSKGNASERAKKLSQFNEDPEYNLCLLLTGTAAAGLTLTVSYTLYMLEPISNAADEAQAINRVHRIGQTRAVRCIIFYVKGSCEERLLAMRQGSGTLTSQISSVDGIQHEGKAEGKAKGENEGRKGKEKARITTKKNGESEEYMRFYDAEQLKILYGCSEERRALVQSESAATSSNSNSNSNRVIRDISTMARLAQPFHYYSAFGRLHGKSSAGWLTIS
jgi:E3 ubiquitin-protein ligase SHPRH